MFTFDEDCVSDLHKDAYGFRPCQAWFAEWKSMDDTSKQAEWDRLIVIMAASEKQAKIAEEKMTTIFEASVTATINAGAKDRQTALRWLMDASTCDGDWDYFCWTHGLPFKYFSKLAIKNG